MNERPNRTSERTRARNAVERVERARERVEARETEASRTIDLGENVTNERILTVLRGLRAPVSIAVNGRVIPIRTEGELGMLQIGLDLGWDNARRDGAELRRECAECNALNRADADMCEKCGIELKY